MVEAQVDTSGSLKRGRRLRARAALATALLVLGLAAPTAVVQAADPSTTVVVASDSSPAFGAPVTFTATVTGTGTPTGDVQFKVDTVDTGSPVALDGAGAAQFSPSSLSPGLHTIEADYAGVGANAPSSGTADVTVGVDASGTALVSDVNPSVHGQSVTFTATVSGGVLGTPTGDVTFRDGVVTIGSAVVLDGSGVAAVTTSAIAVGTHTITAVYSGDSNYATSTGTLGSDQVVDKAASASTITATVPPTSGVGGSYVVDVTVVAVAPGTGTPGGHVDVDDGTGATCLVAALVAGAGSCSLTSTTAGSKTITADYSGDGNFTGSTNTATHVVDPPSTTTVTSDSNPSTYGESVHFTAHVDAGGPVVDGTVQFKIDGADLGTPASLNGSGDAASIDAAGLITAGTHTITAEYSGFGTIAASTGTLSPDQVVTPAVLTPHITASDKVYNGTTAATILTRTLTGSIVGGDVVTLTGGTATFATRDVGTGILVTATGLSLGGADAANYTLASTTDSTTANITAKPITVTAVASSKAYDGDTSSAGVPTITGGLGTGDTAAFIQTYDTPNVGTNKTLTPSGSVNDGNSGANYDVTFAAVTTGTITHLAVTPHITASDKVYDGGTSATIATRTLTGVLGTDDVSLTGGTATFATKTVASNKTVTATGLSLTGADAANYSLTSTSATDTANITVRTLTVTATGVDKVYNGTTAATVSLSDDRVGGDVLTATYASALFVNRNVGTAKTINVTGIAISGSDAANYTLASTTDSTTANITAKPITVTAVASSKAYDGDTSSAGVPTITGGLGTGDTAAFIQTYDTPNVGTNKTLTPSGSVNDGNSGANYDVTFAAVTTGTITHLAVTPHITASDKVYDGGTSATIATRTLTGVLGTDDVSLTGGTATFATKTVASNKTVTATGLSLTGADAANYSLTSTSATDTANITVRTLTVTATGVDKVYNGTTAATVSLSDDRVGGDVLTITHNPATFADPSVGVAKTVTVTGIAISGGADALNYTLASTSTTATADITAKTLTPHITAADKVYDGTTDAAIVTRTLTGVVGTDDATLIGGTATFADANFGIGKTVTAVGMSLTGVDAGNYQLSSTSATDTANISKLAITVTAVSDSKVYDGTTSSAGVPTIAPPLAPGDTPSFTQAFANPNVGVNKVLTPSGSVADGNGGANYAVTFDAVSTGTITVRTLTVTATGVNKVYSGTIAATVNLSDNRVGGDVLTITHDPATYADRDIGTAKVVSVTGIAITGGADAANYTLFATDASTTADITARPITVTAAASTKVYDGTTDSAVVPTISGGLGAGDTAAFIQTYDTPGVDTGKALTPSGAVTDGNGGANYAVTFTATATGTITKAPLTVTADPAPRPYGSSDPVFTATISGFVNGETLGTSGVTGTPDCSANDLLVSDAGNTFPITCTAGTLAADNYSFGPFVNGTLTITQVPLTVTADPQTRQFGFTDPPLTATITGFVLSQDATAVSGIPDCTTDALLTSPVGSYTITCTIGTLTATNYSFPAPNFVTGTLAVTKAITAAALLSDVNPAPPTQPLTITATITGIPSSETGTVQFQKSTDGSTGWTDFGSAVPVTTGGASLMAATSDTAVDTLFYRGEFTPTNGNYADATSPNLHQVVGKSDVTVTVISTPVTWETGVSLGFKATLVPAATGATVDITGNVTFHDGATTLGIATPVKVSGVWTATLPAGHVLALGAHTITADYAGDTSYNAGTGNLVSSVITNTLNATGVGVSGTSIYPVHDNWRDTVAIRGTRNEPISVLIAIYSPKNKRLVLKSFGTATGAYSYTWTGKSGSHILPAGRYKVVQTLTDRTDTTGRTKRVYTSYVTLSTKTMTWHTVTVNVTKGPRHWQMAWANTGSTISPTSSTSTGALVMSTVTGDWIGVGYQFAVPSASTYRSISFQVMGSWTGSIAPKIGLNNWAISTNFATEAFSHARPKTDVGTASTRWYVQTQTDGSRYVRSRTVRAFIDTGDYFVGTFHYTVTKVRLVVSYGILK